MASLLSQAMKEAEKLGGEVPDPTKDPSGFKSWVIKLLIGAIGVIAGGFINDYKETRESMQAVQINIASMTETQKYLAQTQIDTLAIVKRTANSTADLKARVIAAEERVGIKKSKTKPTPEPEEEQ